MATERSLKLELAFAVIDAVTPVVITNALETVGQRQDSLESRIETQLNERLAAIDQDRQEARGLITNLTRMVREEVTFTEDELQAMQARVQEVAASTMGKLGGTAND